MTPEPPGPPTDMSPEEFRRYGHEVVDWIAAYLADPGAYPVLARVRPGEVLSSFPAAAPEAPIPFDRILEEFREKVLPGITHWNHPGFLAYFAISGSAPGILGEALAAALNVNAMLWRTSPAATELELLATDWLRQMVGLPDGFHGHIQDSASSSTLVAIAAAREATGLDTRRTGLSGRDLPRLVLYCSEEAHSSVDKAAITLGIGSDNVRRIPTDPEFRMDSRALAAAIARDEERGARPFCVVATVGTTSTTSVDPVRDAAEICRRHGLWLHVDAAYAGAAAVVPELRDRMAGWELAESIVLNPHKWLFVPTDCSVLLLRDPDAVRRAFTLVPEYLSTPEGDSVTNLMDFGHALGRRFRALKLWMTLSFFGRLGLAERIREHVRLARRFADWVSAEPDWELAAPVPFSTVCFRYAPADLSPDEVDRANQRIVERANSSGEIFLSTTRLRGRLTLRLAIGNLHTREEHVRRAWEILRAEAPR